ncbi:DUF547 domain-containing protein [Minwuia sp.]|uniref:DUF547 domain-containing protein n=1 Tax=Minwuia sp. TaxID=2493630 RepID=UPI003A91962E
MAMKHLRLIVLVFALFWPALTSAAPRADLWERWIPLESDPSASVDHSAWNGFLARFVIQGGDGLNRFDYGAVRPQDRADLQRYLADLSAIRPTVLNRPEAMAYWINLYNALTVDVVLDHYPVDSIRDIDISPGFFSSGPWGAKLFEVEGVALSLDDIEHRILRPIWQTPLIHYAVNCASIGCPNLRAEAFEAARLAQQLDDAARTFVNHPRAVRVSGRVAEVSSIYDWFRSDFGSTDREVIDHLIRFAESPLAAQLRRVERIGGDFYDWRLNDTASPGG